MLVAVLGLALLSGDAAPRAVSASGRGAYEVSMAAAEAGPIALAWYDTRNRGADIYLRLLAGDGRRRHPVVRLTTTSTQSSIPAIRASGDGFAVAWNEYRPGTGGVHADTGRSEIWFTRRAF
jgi:hypothetical protein